MHFSPNEVGFTNADKQLTNLSKVASFDNTNWVSEATKL
jgi:hypothetical protein